MHKKVMSLSLLAILLFTVICSVPARADSSQTVEASVELKHGPFLGKMMKDPQLPKPVMVMVDNAPSARPQYGLEDASIVYEFLVEGGVTRFLALFYEKVPGRVGPVRSTRSYFIQTALEYNALLLHVGASPDGYKQLTDTKIDHRDQITDGNWFWRDDKQVAPCNVYTVQQLPDLLKVKEAVTVEGHFPFRGTVSNQLGKAYAATKATLHYAEGYKVNYQYDEDKEGYVRMINGTPHQMANGKKVYAKNILIQFVNTRVSDQVGRLEMTLVGSGKALFFKEGYAFVGTWTKKEGGKTYFLDELGKEWQLEAGQTWIQVIPSTAKVEYH
jgi:hypothetical protein